jgi:NADPH:quinone reductase-like Zn-dependent oxidoreductase
MGCDLVGRVVNVGDRCDDIKLGDRVCAVGLGIGGNAKYAILPSSRVFCCPEDIDPTVVACLARNYMAAYQCLHRAGGMKIRPGSKVLILGGAGALGQALIQLAISAGADEVYATGKGSNSKRIIENLGAQSLGRKPGEWLPYVKGEMDIVVDSVCTDDLVSSQRALSRTGKLVCVGGTAIAKKSYNWNSGLDPSQRFYVVELASSQPKTSFYDVFSSLEMKRDIFRKDLFRLFHLCRNHEITPKVAFCVTLDEVANVHLDLEAGGIDGTVICLPFGPEGTETNVSDEGQDQITTYDDGIRLRKSMIGGTLPSIFGKVMKDGTFKVLNKKREEYDDDLYSMAGGIQRSNSQVGIKRVDSTPFGFQDDMEKSYYGGVRDDEDNDSDSRMSSYKSPRRKNLRQDDDNHGRSGRQAIPRPRNPSRRETREDFEDAFDSGRNRREGGRGYGGHYEDPRGGSRNSSRRDDDDDVRSVRSRKDRGIFRDEDLDVEDDLHSVHSRSKSRSGRRRNITMDMLDEVDDYASVGRSSKAPQARPHQLFEIKRTTSILRNSKKGSFRPSSRGASPRYPSSNGRYDSDSASSRHMESYNDVPPSRGASSHHARPSSRGSVRQSSRGRRSNSQPVTSRTNTRDIAERGRTRSRSVESRPRSPSPSSDSVYSQGTQGSQRSRGTVQSSYTSEEQTSDDLSTGTSSKGTEYTPEEPQRAKPIPIRKKAAPPKKKSVPIPKPAVIVDSQKPKKKGLLSRFRSRSRNRIQDQQVAAPITAKPKVKSRPESKSKVRQPATDSGDRHARKERASSRANGSKVKGDRKERSSTRDRSGRNTKDRTRDRDHYRSSSNKYEDADESVTSGDAYEEAATRSIVSLNCASNDSIETDLGEPEPVLPHEPRLRSTKEKPRSALKNSSSSRPHSALRPSSSPRKSASRSSQARPSSSRPSSSRHVRSSSRSSRRSSSARDVYDDEY